MPSTPREIGTLIVVILKARHLPNKRHIGKQAPYCTVSFNSEKRRTKAIKKGGQHPEWDEELRFTLFEDMDADFEIIAHPDGSPPPPPPKESKSGPKKVKGGTVMKLYCFADDPREPELIGEAAIDLTEVLTIGETDEWFTLMHKEKFSGEVYLELTFFSNEPVPEKKVSRKPPKMNQQYGGTGVFVPYNDDGLTGPSNNYNDPPSRVASMSMLQEHSRQSSSSVSSQIRTSSSLAQLDLYVPPYESRRRASPIDSLSQDFNEMGVLDHSGRSEHSRRDSLPVPPGSHLSHRWPTSSPYGASAENLENPYGDDRSITPSYTGDTYDPHPPTSYPPPKPHSRSARYSLPMSSSGFVPLASRPSEPSGFVSHNTGYTPRISSGFLPTSTSTPAPVSYTASLLHSNAFPSQMPNPQSSSMPFPSQTPHPHFPSQTPTPSTFTAHPSPLPQSQSYQYNAPYPSNQSYTLPPPSVPSHPHSAPPLINPGHSLTPSPSHEHMISSSSSNSVSGSRPLPQPTGPSPLPIYAPPMDPPYVSSTSYPPHDHYSSPQTQIPPSSSYHSVPPPPPPPLITSNSYLEHDVQHHPINIPPPPPLNSYAPNPPQPPPPRRQSSLPQPPVSVRQQSHAPISYHSIPPPPSMDQHAMPQPPLPPAQPIEYYTGYPPPAPYYTGPPPQPPAHYDDHNHWAAYHEEQSYAG